MGCTILLCTVAIAFTLTLCEASKLRSWLGPTNFAQGTAPSKRYGHGFAEIDGSFYVFGGFGTGQHGLSFKKLLYFNIVINEISILSPAIFAPISK